VCVNIDPSLPSGRIHEMLRETQSTIIVASHAKKQLMEDSAPSAVTMITVPSTYITGSSFKAFIGPLVRPQDTAFVIFTSGSTGRPKGIVIKHMNLSTSIRSHYHNLNIQPDTRALHFAAYAWDVSLYEIFTTLVVGGCVCIPSEFDRANN